MIIKYKIFTLLIVLVVGISACKKKESTVPDYHKGELTVVTDPAFESVTTALAEGYMHTYPDTRISVQAKKEDLALLDLINKKTKAIVMSRELTPAEVAAYEKNIDLEVLPSNFAADAVIFVVPKNSTREKISYEEIVAMLQTDEKELIFSGTNSSDLNYVAQTLNKKPADLKYSIISGSENLISELEKHPGKVGAIGLNILSRPYGEEAKKLRDQIKILPVEKQGKLHEANANELLAMSYPFTRVLYFLTNEGNFAIASGFIRYSCTHLGQMIVQKEGLQKYNLYMREVQMR